MLLGGIVVTQSIGVGRIAQFGECKKKPAGARAELPQCAAKNLPDSAIVSVIYKLDQYHSPNA